MTRATKEFFKQLRTEIKGLQSDINEDKIDAEAVIKELEIKLEYTAKEKERLAKENEKLKKENEQLKGGEHELNDARVIDYFIEKCATYLKGRTSDYNKDISFLQTLLFGNFDLTKEQKQIILQFGNKSVSLNHRIINTKGDYIEHQNIRQD